ncbi:hypothetical protein TYRP_011069 [Tyrophagus putrescentiae]|nr:hypothetical protein TYRP_011069 [Tyrophagus putrescentiae]
MSAKLLKLTLMVLAAGLIDFISSAPTINRTNRLEQSNNTLNATEQSIVQQCLYYGPLVAKSLFGPHFPTAFCKSLHSPELGDPLVKVSLLSPRELLMRQHFYQEAAYLWSLYRNVSYCALRPTGPAAEQCLNTTSNGTAVPRYEGLFPEDFNSRKYLLLEKMSEAVVRYNPAMSDLEHCFHLHNQERQKFFQLWDRHVPCFRFNILGSSLDHLQAAAVSAEVKAAWREKVANRHFELRVDIGINLKREKEETMSWQEVEDQLYNGLYINSDLILGATTANISSQAEELQSRIGKLYNGWHTDLQGEELEPQERRLRDHLKSNKIVDKAYDCWKFHLNEQMFWCLGVTPEWETKDLFTSGFLTGKFVYSSTYMLRVREFIEAERMAEQKAIDDVSAHLLAFLALPEKIVTYCRFDRRINFHESHDYHLGETWDEDCLEGGVYSHFFERETFMRGPFAFLRE